MGSVFGKVQNFLLGNNEDDVDYIDDEDELDEAPPRREYERKGEVRDKKRDNVTKLYPDARYEIILNKPKTLEDATGVVNNLRMNNVCVVSLEGIEKTQAQRIVDFLSGSAFALGSAIERISNDIFIIAPDGITIAGKLKSDVMSESAVFPWIASR